MSYIVLTEEQLQVLQHANGPVDVQDAEGRPVASLRVLDEFDRKAIERWKQLKEAGPRKLIPSEQVKAHLRRLSEIRDAEGLDREKMLDLLRRMQAGEEV